MLLLGDCGYTENDAGFIRLVPRLTPIPKPIISDLTNNGFVDFEDLTVLLADWTGPGPAASPESALGDAVPEPSSLLLALLATIGLSFYRRRRRRAF